MEKYIDNKYIYSDLSARIIAIAFEVHNGLGPGHSEKAYQRAFAFELRSQGINYVEQVTARIVYKGEKVGIRKFDFEDSY